MAVNISDTKHYKKGEKLPDGTTAKRGVVWNTKTGKRVTGKVVMAGAGSGGMGATKSYKAGRSVAASKRAAAKKARPSAKGGGQMPGRPSSPPTKTPPPSNPPLTAAQRAAKKRAAAAKAQRTGRRVTATAGRAANIMAREKSGASTTSTSRPRTTSTPSNLTGFSGNKPGSIGNRGGFGGMQSARPQSSGGPKKGDVKQTMVGASIYDGKKWVRAVKKNGKWVAA